MMTRQEIKANAKPGESWSEAEIRLQRKKYADQQKSTAGPELPKSDEQSDFFVPKLYCVGLRDRRSLMDGAVFRLSKRDKRNGDLIRYEVSDGYVEVTAGPYGMATIWDYDIVLMMVSHLTEAMDRFRDGKGEKPGRIYRPHVCDILKFCHRGDGGKQYKEVERALDRLSGTKTKSIRKYQTENGGTHMREAESEDLISHYKVLSYSDSGNIELVEIEAPKGLYKEITEGENPKVLSVHPDYFLINTGIGRFVYRLAKCVPDSGRRQGKYLFRTVYERSGSAGTFKEFCRLLRKIIQANNLPDFDLKEIAGRGGPLLVTTWRGEEIAQTES